MPQNVLVIDYSSAGDRAVLASAGRYRINLFFPDGQHVDKLKINSQVCLL